MTVQSATTLNAGKLAARFVVIMTESLWDEGPQEMYARQFSRAETFIPFRSADICRFLESEFKKEQFQGLHTSLMELNRSLTSMINLNTVYRFDEWEEDYSFLDPDADVLLELSDLNAEDAKSRSFHFQERLSKALDDSGFEKLTKIELEEAANTTSIFGLNVVPPSNPDIHTVTFVRGRRKVQHTRREWRSLWLVEKSHELKNYQRVMLLLTRDKSEDITCCNWFMNCFLPSSNTLDKAINPNKIYLKMFKDIEMCDIDMLVPGSAVQFTKWDYFLLFVPLLIGLISAAVKTAYGTLDFSTLQNSMTSGFLVILPLIYAFKAYMNFRQTQNTYNAKLTELLSLHTLASNSGLVH